MPPRISCLSCIIPLLSFAAILLSVLANNTAHGLPPSRTAPPQSPAKPHAAKASGSFDDAIADSMLGFSAKQSGNGWSYGFSQGNGVIQPFAQFSNGAWHNNGQATPSVTLDTLTPIPEAAAVRRWRPARAGSVRLVGMLQKMGSTTVNCQVLVNGREAWSRVLDASDTIPHAFDILLTGIPKGAVVDMGVSGASPVSWKTQILEESCTAWRPNLPIGPTFTEAQKNDQRRRGKAVLIQMNALVVSPGGSLRIPPGDYRFSGSGAAYPHVRNLKRGTINAQGVTFWFDAPSTQGLEFDDCRDVTVKGLTLDCDPMPFFQARITAIDTHAGTVTAELMPGYEPGEDGGNRTVSYYLSDGSYIRNGIIPCEWNHRPGTNLVDIKAPAPGAQVGDYLACVIRTGQQLRSIGCGGMRFEDVNLYAGGGMAVIEVGGPGGSVYHRVRATRRPGTNRLHAFGADGFHFSGVGVGPVLDRCEAAYLADDEVNLHGQFGRILKTFAPNHYLLSGTYSVGQSLDFWGFVELESLGSAHVTRAVRTTDAETWDVTLDKNLPLPADVLIDKHTQTTGGYTIKNCWFHDTGQRFLVNGAPDGTIENNTFQNIGGNIAIGNESWNGYTEGAFPSGTVFRDNRLIDLAGGLTIALNPGGRPGRGVRRSMPIKNVTVEGNDFDGGGLVLDATQVEGLKIRNNVFDRPFAADTHGTIDDAYGDLLNAPIRLTTVRHAVVEGNIIYDPQRHAEGRIVSAGPLTSDIVVNGTRLWNIVADSFSSWYPETQGGRSWSFGTLDNDLTQHSTYSTGDLVPLRVLDGGNWKSAPGNTFPLLGRTGVRPSASQTVIRRWVSTVAGTARIDALLQTPSAGDGVLASVYIDGVREWQLDTGDHQVHNVSIPLHDLKVGTVIDFLIDSKGDMNGDYTTFYAKILTPPHPAGN